MGFKKKGKVLDMGNIVEAFIEECCEVSNTPECCGNPDNYRSDIIKKGDIVMIRWDSENTHSILKKMTGLKWLKRVETLDPDFFTDALEEGHFEIIDINRIRQEIKDRAKELHQVVADFKATQIEMYGEWDNDYDEVLIEYYELCTLCILIDDKQLWDDIVLKAYGAMDGEPWYKYFDDDELHCWDEQKYGNQEEHDPRPIRVKKVNGGWFI